MKIAFLMQDTGAVYGAERATLDLVSGLALRGVEAGAVLMEETRLGRAGSALREALDARRIRWRALPVDHAFSPGLVRRIERTVREDAVGLLHTVGYKANVHGWLAARAARVPVVATVHGWLFRADRKERFYGWLDLRILARCAAVVALSRHYAQFLEEKGIPAERLAHIPSGLPAAALPDPAVAAAPPSVPLVVGMLGRLSDEKNHAMLLRAACRLRDEGVKAHFLVAGDGPLRAWLRDEVARRGLAETVRLAGFMQQETFFRSVHALASCSRIENLPYSVLEAMAWRRPVVATRVGGLPDLVEDGVTGRLIPPDDDEALAACVRAWAQRPESVREMGDAGRAFLEQSFTLDRCLDRHLQLYQRLLS